MSTKLKNLYLDRIQKFEDLLEGFKKKELRLSILRLVFFLLGIILIVYLFNHYWMLAIPVSYLFIFLFGKLINHHQAISKNRKQTEALIKINQSEIQRLDLDFTEIYDGEKFLDDNHSYASDLDIFGSQSIYQFFNRCSTYFGQALLAKYLTELPSQDEIEARQKCVKELSSKLDWRQRLQAEGTSVSNEPNQIEQIQSWVETDRMLPATRSLRWMLILASIVSWILCYLLITKVSWTISYLGFIPAVLVLLKYHQKMNLLSHQINKNEKPLLQYADMIQHIETEQFEYEVLKKLKHGLNDEASASKNLKRLSKIISQLNIRYNLFGILFNVMFLWELHWGLILEDWKDKNKIFLAKWFEILASFETLQSIASIAYNYPNWAFAQIVEDKEYMVKALGHPLLHESVRINNDFKTPTHQHIKLVTGSNMAGKSTFLRSVGTSVVMGLMGAPVCCSQMHLPIMKLFTSMRTKDALKENTSSFYAELKRLKTCLEMVEREEDIFFLLDEILKGTNSEDRHKGSIALINQLNQRPSAGLISTHDLRLGKLESESNGKIENICFEVAVENDELIFDYKVKKGISKSFNATHLMRNMGIDV